MKLAKSATFTDIHWGTRNNSEQHNIDCTNFIKWFSEEVKKDPEIDHIMFLGDWYENRSAINVQTLNYSYEGAKILNDIGLPVYFLVGNHDLYLRNSRDIFSTTKFADLSNFIIVDSPMVAKEIGDGGALLCPYMFHEEYPKLKRYKKKTWWGHFEFKGFVVTGETITLDHGPDHKEFKNPTRIFSGHFHKRQATDNVIYVGNPFGTKFSDSNDFNKGMMIYDHNTDDVTFRDWKKGPKYVTTSFSKIIDSENIDFPRQSRVKCYLDIVIDYEQQLELKKAMVENFDLREFKFEEPILSIAEAVAEEIDIDPEEIESISDLIITMLDKVDTGKGKIKTEKLKELYLSLKVDDE